MNEETARAIRRAQRVAGWALPVGWLLFVANLAFGIWRDGIGSWIVTALCLFVTGAVIGFTWGSRFERRFGIKVD